MICRFSLRLINYIFALLGLAILGYALYLYWHVKHDQAISGYPWYVPSRLLNATDLVPAGLIWRLYWQEPWAIIRSDYRESIQHVLCPTNYQVHFRASYAMILGVKFNNAALAILNESCTSHVSRLLNKRHSLHSFIKPYNSDQLSKICILQENSRSKKG